MHRRGESSATAFRMLWKTLCRQLRQVFADELKSHDMKEWIENRGSSAKSAGCSAPGPHDGGLRLRRL